MRQLIILLILCSSLIMPCVAQSNNSAKASSLNNIYQVFDFVHNAMYLGSAEPKQSLSKIKATLSNNYFTQKDRKTLTVEGETLMTKLQKAWSIDKETYDFQYCGFPSEQAQTDSTYCWYNKIQKDSSFLEIKKENGLFRIVKLEIGMTAVPSETKLLRSYACDNSLKNAVIRGKRAGIMQLKPNTPVLAYNEENGFWQEATFLEKSDRLFIVEFADNIKKEVTQIAPVLIQKYDWAFVLENNKLVRKMIYSISEETVTLSSGTNAMPVNRKDLYFKINNYLKADTDALLFVH